jgi:hypothetical protein
MLHLQYRYTHTHCICTRTQVMYTHLHAYIIHVHIYVMYSKSECPRASAQISKMLHLIHKLQPSRQHNYFWETKLLDLPSCTSSIAITKNMTAASKSEHPRASTEIPTMLHLIRKLHPSRQSNYSWRTKLLDFCVRVSCLPVRLLLPSQKIRRRPAKVSTPVLAPKFRECYTSSTISTHRAKVTIFGKRSSSIFVCVRPKLPPRSSPVAVTNIPTMPSKSGYPRAGTKISTHRAQETIPGARSSSVVVCVRPLPRTKAARFSFLFGPAEAMRHPNFSGVARRAKRANTNTNLFIEPG